MSKRDGVFQSWGICFINSFSNSPHSVSGSEDKCSDSGEESHTKYLPDHKNSSCPSLRLILVEFEDENTVCHELVEILYISGGQGSCLSLTCMKNHLPIGLFIASPVYISFPSLFRLLVVCRPVSIILEMTLETTQFWLDRATQGKRLRCDLLFSFLCLSVFMPQLTSSLKK